MNEVNIKKIRDWITSHQFNMNVRLPDEQNMKYARNAWCHLYGILLDAYQLRGTVHGLNKIPDSEFDNSIKLLQIANDYAEDPDVYNRLPKIDQKIIDEIHHKQTTLDDWFTNS